MKRNLLSAGLWGAFAGLLASGASPLAAANRIFIANQTLKVGDSNALIPVRADTDQERHGISISIKYDAAKLAVSAVETAGTATATAEWSNGQIVAAQGALSWGLVMDLSDPLTNTLPVGNNQVLVNLRVNVAATQPGTTSVTPQDGLGQPAGGWINLFSSRGVNTIPQLQGGEITIEARPAEGNRFLLGDCNGDKGAQPDISDAVSFLGFLFLGGATPVCMAACNVNGDALGDISDAVTLLTYLFLGGDPPRPPFPACDSKPVAECGQDICRA